MVDVQTTMQSGRGFGIITRNGAIRRLTRVVQLFHSQKAAFLPGSAAFGFLGPLESENVGVSYTYPFWDDKFSCPKRGALEKFRLAGLVRLRKRPVHGRT